MAPHRTFDEAWWTLEVLDSSLAKVGCAWLDEMAGFSSSYSMLFTRIAPGVPLGLLGREHHLFCGRVLRNKYNISSEMHDLTRFLACGHRLRNFGRDGQLLHFGEDARWG
mmetsp:Transcript_91156/g.174868  ORF Transcript_91156/g.174868 Transcript_91156/m.174868 type:complete len:110 (-) Transcript_91156:671-1000(-)